MNSSGIIDFRNLKINLKNKTKQKHKQVFPFCCMCVCVCVCVCVQYWFRCWWPSSHHSNGKCYKRSSQRLRLETLRLHHKTLSGYCEFRVYKMGISFCVFGIRRKERSKCKLHLGTIMQGWLHICMGGMHGQLAGQTCFNQQCNDTYIYIFHARYLHNDIFTDISEQLL